MVRLLDLWRGGQLTLSEYQAYLDLGYDPDDPVQLSSGRSAEMVTVSYMNLGAGRSWTLKSGETLFGYIGPNADLANAGDMTVAGDALFHYQGGKLTNTGTITITGNFQMYPVRSSDL